MDYKDNIAEGLELSFADLLDRIKEKFGEDEFVLTSKNLKALRRNRWQTCATSVSLSLTDSIFKALEKMAREKDPCIKSLDSSGKSFRFVKSPAVRGKASIRAIPKEEIVQENADLRQKIQDMTAKIEKLKEKLTKEKEKKMEGAMDDEVEAPESYDDFPECYKTSDYAAWIPPCSDVNGKRPRFSAKLYWDAIAKKIPFIATWVFQEDKLYQEKQCASVRAKIAAKKIARKAAKRGPQLKTIICQLYRFVAMTHGLSRAQLKIDTSPLLSVITISSFLEFYSQYNKSPKTTANAAKILSQLLKYMMGLTEFCNRYQLLKQIYRLLLDCMKKKKLHDAIYRASHSLDSQMALKGEWVNHLELSKINAHVSEQLADFIEKFKDNTPSKKEVYEFQSALVLFCFLQTAGQRREVIMGFQVDNFAICDNSVVHFTLHEKVQKRHTDRLTLPDTLGNLLRIWVEKYRPILCPVTSKVTQCFVGYKGKPLLPRCMTSMVINKIDEVFPGRHVGPLCLRRIMVTEMMNAAKESPSEFFQWASKHAALINTSKTMAENVYNCGNNAKQAEKTLATVNNTIGLNPSSTVANKIQVHADKITYLTQDQENIVDIVNMRFVDGQRQYLCKLENGQQVWRDYGLLVGATEKVQAYLAKSTKKQQPLPAEQRAPQSQQLPMPELETDMSESQSSDLENCSCDSDCESCCNLDVDSVSEDSECLSINTNISAAVKQVAAKSGHKRKLSSDNLETVMLSNKELVKAGDIISVNPDDPADKFWLAKVLSIESKNRVHVQWLDWQRNPSCFHLIKHYDDVSIGAINQVASGGWQNSRTYSL